MKAEIGKYARTRCGKIYKITVLDSYTDIMVIKVASTLQGLVNIDTDLICGVNDNKPLSIDIEHDNCYQCGNSYIDFNFVTKIYTPNEDESVYTLQYSKEAE